MRWQTRAECRYDDSVDWLGETLTLDCATTCYVCPVRPECLAEALARQRESDVGIWGGTTMLTRVRLRARKTTLAEVWQELSTIVKEEHDGGSRDVDRTSDLL
jgi:endonuclease YncB( thermonuclease family)